MSDSAGTIGYAAAADAYWQAGWRGVLPLPAQAKNNPPAIYCDTHRPRLQRSGTTSCPDCTHYTGHLGIDPSYPDILAWSEQYPDGNLCLRMPDGVVGIDVDAYGAKTGGRALAEAISRWGPLSSGPRSTSRRDTDPVSGIRLFRIPPSTLLQDRIAFTELGIGDIELCQRHHRYVVAWPSIHPEGRAYWWTNDDMQLIGIPTIDELPWLPQTWIDALRVTPRSLNLNGEHYDVRATLTAGEPSIAVTSRLSQAIKELNLPGQSRHDTCCRHVMMLMRMGKNGDPGVHQALGVLREVLVAARRTDNSNTPDGTRDEFDRMITNDNAARELATPSPLDWMKALSTNEKDPVGNVSGVGVPPAVSENDSTPSGGVEGVDYRDGPAVGVESNASRPHSRLEEIEQRFWDSRESLQMIWQTSMAMMASPWGVLAHCVARALTQVRPHVTLPALIGGPGSLNWFALVTAPPSLGKGTAARTAKLLVPEPIIEWEVGSGEGMIAVYGRNEENRVEAIMFKAEEMDTINALNTRSGSTTLPILRSGFFSESLGSAYSDEKKCRRLEDGAYRMTLIVSTQPERAAWLLADAAGGTPQRFMWFPGSDARVSEEETWPSSPLTLPHASEWQYPREIIIPAIVRSIIRSNHAKNSRGELDALNGHALFSREKLAFALAVLDGRTVMTLEDWELSGIAAAVSDYTRDLTVEAIERAAHEEAAERGVLRGIEMAAATTMRAFEAQQQWPRVVRWVRNKLDAAGDEGTTMRNLSRGAPKSIRQYLSLALEQLAADGLAVNPEKTRWMRL